MINVTFHASVQIGEFMIETRCVAEEGCDSDNCGYEQTRMIDNEESNGNIEMRDFVSIHSTRV